MRKDACVSNGQLRNRAFAAACGAVIVTAFDASATPLAILDIKTDLDVSYVNVAWIFVGYAIAGACIPLVAGWLVERTSSRKVLLAAACLLTIASAAAALSPSFLVLETFRVLQAIGIASALPASLAVIAETYGANRSHIVGIWGMIGGFAAVVGQLVAGVLINVTGWQAVPTVEAAIGAVTVALAWGLPRRAANPDAKPPKFVPILLSAGATLCAATGILSYSRLGGSWEIPAIFGVLAAAMGAGAWYFVRRGKSSVVQPSASPWPLRLNGASTLCFGIAYICVLVAIPLSLNGRVSLGTTGVALLLTPAVLVSAIVQPFAGRLAQRWSHAPVASIGLALLAAGLAVLVAGEELGVAVVVVGSLIANLGAGLANPVLIDASIHYAPAGLSAVSGAVILTIRQLGFALGSALVFAVAGTASTSPVLTVVFAIAGVIALIGVVLLQAMRRAVTRPAGFAAQ